MAVTREQARLNVESATRVLGRQLGFADADGRVIYRNLTAAQQTMLTNALAAYVQARPALFDTGEAGLTNPAVSAAYANNAGQLDASYSFGEFVDESLSGALGVSRFVIGVAVVLGLVFILANSKVGERLAANLAK